MNDYIVRKYLEKRMFKDKTKYIDRPIKTTGLTERMIESFIEYEKKRRRRYIEDEYPEESIKYDLDIAEKIFYLLYTNRVCTEDKISKYLDMDDHYVRFVVLDRMEAFGIITKSTSNRSIYEVSSEIQKIICNLNKIKVFNNSEEVAKRCKEASKTEDILYDVKKIISDKSKFIQYMKHIVRLETDIYALKRRYDSLVIAWEEAVAYGIDDFEKAEQTVATEKAYLQESIDDLKKKINTKPSPTTQYVQLELPIEPEAPKFKERKPYEPDYRVPGIFNKKKITQENNELRIRYEEELNQYNRLYQEYIEREEQFQRDLATYTLKVKDLKCEEKRQNEKAYNVALREYEKQSSEWRIELKEKEEKLDKFDEKINSEIEKHLENSEYYLKKKRIENEIQYVVELMEKCYGLQSKLYSYNVIYGKYRTYVAMSTFIDYFLSGRVASLDGSDGAYNLYEQEFRADIVIGKLDLILDSLEDIKDNQYFLYNELQSVNSTLARINKDLLLNNMLQEAQLIKLDSIVVNTDVAAFYSQKNAELTDALGFMMAL